LRHKTEKWKNLRRYPHQQPRYDRTSHPSALETLRRFNLAKPI
jgi:hypothetical protein